MLRILAIIFGLLFTYISMHSQSKSLPVINTIEIRFEENQKEQIVKIVTEKYKYISKSEIENIVEFSMANSRKDGFPTVIDILAIIDIESGFNCNAVSKGNYGCMQINKRAWPDFPRQALYDSETNIAYGAFILKYLGLSYSDSLRIVNSYRYGRSSNLINNPTDYSNKFFESKKWLIRELGA